MSPYLAYVLGILTVILIFLPFWLLSQTSEGVANAYSSVFCDQIDPGE